MDLANRVALSSFMWNPVSDSGYRCKLHFLCSTNLSATHVEEIKKELCISRATQFMYQ